MRIPEKNYRVLALDPGYERLGLAVVEKDFSIKKGEKLLYSECFKTENKLPHAERLFLIGEKLRKIITEFAPTDLAIETLFFNDNQKTAFKVAEARGGYPVHCCFGKARDL
jgi:crossover junction endodeoxyribonuclease RuvC